MTGSHHVVLFEEPALPFFSQLIRKLRNSVELLLSLDQVGDALAQHWADRVRADPVHAHPRCLVRHGYKVYSQCDEDGLIAEIFERIGVTSRTFVEIGVGDGTENNSLALLFAGWSGVWVEASSASVKRIRKGLRRTLASGRLRLVGEAVTRENADDLLRPVVPAEEIDLLSIDIDGNDFHVWQAITVVRPRVVVMEYNGKFRPPVEYCMPYDATHRWRGDDEYGASLAFLANRLGERGYRLVGCGISGVNAYFVREDLLQDRFLEPYTAETHYQPRRWALKRIVSGHSASLATLDGWLSRETSGS